MKISDLSSIEDILFKFMQRLLRPMGLLYFLFVYFMDIIMPPSILTSLLITSCLLLPFFVVGYEVYLNLMSELIVINNKVILKCPFVFDIHLKNIKILYVESESLYYLIYDKNWGIGAIPMFFKKVENAHFLTLKLKESSMLNEELICKRLSLYKRGVYTSKHNNI